MSSQPPIRRSDLPANLRQALDELEPRVQSSAAATVVWTKHFTDEERKRLGDDPYRAWKEHGRTAGMWATVRECSQARAIAEIAFALDWLDSETYRQLLEALGEGPGEAMRPRWIARSGELWFDGEVVRTIRSAARAKNVVRVLSTFEESNWPPRIDDPVTSGGDSGQRRRTIESLNKGLTRIRFACTGDGQSFSWEVLPTPAPKTAARKPSRKKPS